MLRNPCENIHKGSLADLFKNLNFTDHPEFWYCADRFPLKKVAEILNFCRKLSEQQKALILAFSEMDSDTSGKGSVEDIVQTETGKKIW